jgi:hypothetical protein
MQARKALGALDRGEHGGRIHHQRKRVRFD